MSMGQSTTKLLTDLHQSTMEMKSNHKNDEAEGQLDLPAPQRWLDWGYGSIEDLGSTVDDLLLF